MKKYWPLALFTLITIIFFWPIISDINHVIFGNTNGFAKDGLQNIWNFWWAKHTCLGLCGDFRFTDYMFYPVGTGLLFQTFALPYLALFLPFLLLGLSAVVAYNISLILSMFLAFTCSYLLIKYLTKNYIAATLAATMYGLSPFFIGHILDGQLDLASIWLFPLFILFLLRQKEGYKYSIFAGLLLLSIGTTAYTYLFVAAILWSILLITELMSKNNSWRQTRFRNSITLVVFLPLFLLITFPNFLHYHDYQINGQTRLNPNITSANLRSFVTPPPYTILGKALGSDKVYKKELDGAPSDRMIYCGLVLTLLAVIGVFAKRKDAMPWIALAATGLVLSLGNQIHLNKSVLGPKLLFEYTKNIPILEGLRWPSRFSIIILISMIVLSGYGLVYLLEKIKKKYISTIFIVALSLILIDQYPTSLETRQLYISNGYNIIKNDISNFTVLDLPLMWSSGLVFKGFSANGPLVAQTLYEKRMIDGYATRLTKKSVEYYKSNVLLDYIIDGQDDSNYRTQPNYQIQQISSSDLASGLRTLNIKYIIVHKKLEQNRPSDKFYRVLENQLISSHLGEIIFSDSEINILRITENLTQN